MKFNINQYIVSLKYLVNINSSSGNIIGINHIANFFMKNLAELPQISYLKLLNKNLSPCLVASNAQPDEKLDLLILADLDTLPINDASNFLIKNTIAYGLGTAENKGAALLGLFTLQNANLQVLSQKFKFAYILNSHSNNSTLNNQQILQEYSRRSNFVISLANTNTQGKLSDSRYGVSNYRIEFEAPPLDKGIFNEEHSALLFATNFIRYMQGLKSITDNTFINFTILNNAVNNPDFIPNKLALALQINFLDNNFIAYFEKRLRAFTLPYSRLPCKIYYENRLFSPALLKNNNTTILKQYVDSASQAMNSNIKWGTAFGKSNGILAHTPNCAMIEGMGPIVGIEQDNYEYLDLQSVIPRAKLLIKTIDNIVKNKERRKDD